MLHRLFCLIRKELQALLNNKQGRIMLIMPVILQTAIFPFAATLEVRNSSLGLYDEDGSAQSVELIQRLSQAAAFTHIVPLTSNRALQQAIDNQSVLIGVHIPADFSRRLQHQQDGQVQIIVDGRRSNSGQIAAGAVTGHQRALGVETERPASQPAPDLQTVIERRRKRMLRREPVIDRDHQHAQGRRQFGTDEVVGVQAPYNPPAAMQINNARRATGRRRNRRLIGPHRDTGQFKVHHVEASGTWRGERPAHLAVGLAQAGEATVGAVEADGFLDEGRHLFGKRIRRHETAARSGRRNVYPCRSEPARDNGQR